MKELVSINGDTTATTFDTVGDILSYRITVTNTGNVTLRNLSVTDSLTGMNETIAVFEPGAVQEFTTNYTIAQSDLDQGSVTNSAKATANDPNGDSLDPENPDDGEVTTPGVQSSSMTLTKATTSTGPYALNDYITYELTVTNTGNVTLYDIVVTDANAEIVSGSPVAQLAPGATATVTARHQVTQADLDAGQVTNQASVTADDPGGNPIPEVSSDDPSTSQPNDPTVVELDQRPGLSLMKKATVEGPYQLGDYINFELIVTNTGNVTLHDIVVTDANAEIVSGSPVAQLAPGASATVIARHRITQDDLDFGRVINQAKAVGNDPEGNPIPEVPSDDPSTQQPNDPTVVELDQRPGLSLTKKATGEGPYQLGDYINFELIVTNTGNVTLHDVVVTDINAEIVSGSPIAQLAPGASATVVARHLVTQADVDAGRVVNQAKVTGKDPDGNMTPEVPSDDPSTPQPNDPTEVELAHRPGLGLTKRVMGEGPYRVGDYITFELVVTNTGNVTLTAVTVTDENAEIVSGSPIAQLIPGTSATVIARHRVTQADIDAGRVVNQASVTAEDPDGNPIPEVPSDDPTTPQPNDPTTVEFEVRPALAMTKRATSEGPYDIGDYIKYFDIVVTNVGNVTLTNITVTDNNAEIISGSPIARLRPGESAVVMARHLVTQDDIDVGQVVNQAQVSGDDPTGNRIPPAYSDDPDTPEPGDATITPVAQTARIRIEKRADRAQVQRPGEEITYLLEVVNTGNVTLRNVTVSDPLTGLRHQIAQLKPGVGNRHTVRTYYVVPDSVMSVGKVVNKATVTAIGPDGDQVADSSTVEVSIYYRLIEAEPDHFGPVNGHRGGVTGNVLTNDRIDGQPIDRSTVILTRVPSNEPSPLTLNEDGTVVVAPNTPAGTYTLVYQICDVVAASNCVTATVTVDVVPPVIEANDETVTGVNGYEGGSRIINVLENDRLDGQPINPEAVTLTPIQVDRGLRLNEDGTVDVSADTPAGSYTIEYQLCEKLNPDNCVTAKVTVVVEPPVIDANDDAVTGVNGYDGTTNVINVLTNDQLNGRPLNPEEVTLTPTNVDPALRLNTNGSVDVLPGTRGGTYTLEYQICEKLNPGNCATASVTITVVNPLKIPNVFTPNGDGKNDRFEIIGIEGFDKVSLHIVNRWGNEVYRSDNYRNDWDGGSLNEGTYYYLVVTYRGNTQERHTGWVLIKRQ